MCGGGQYTAAERVKCMGVCIRTGLYIILVLPFKNEQERGNECFVLSFRICLAEIFEFSTDNSPDIRITF